VADAAKTPLRLGGMALANGLLVHGPAHWAAAVRRPDGSIAVASGRKPALRMRTSSVPFARGVASMAEALAVVPLVRRALPEARLPFESRRVLAAIGVTAVAGTLLRRRGSEAAAMAIGVVPSLVALRSGETAAYHGAEHKAIGAYETGAEDHTKEHDRCGSHLMTPLVAANAAGAALLKRAAEEPSPLAKSAMGLASLGAAVEVFAWSERHPYSIGARALRLPGHELQRLVGTREPSAEQLEVAQAALAEILRAEGV